MLLRKGQFIRGVKMKDAFRLDIARRISFVSIIANIALSILKIAIGYIARSSAIIADGFHSIST